MIRIRHQEKSLTQIFLEFFRLGLISFGGPAAHMALMEQELVSRKKWVNRQQFLDFMGGVNLIPGPSATQMTLLIGYRLRGFWGMIVGGLGWITSEQLLDAIAIGQFTPGPVLSSATFIGYLLDGPKGALIATAGIFLPSWFFILVLYPFIDRLRKSPLTAAFLDSVNVAAVAIMVVVMLTFSAQVLIAWQPIMIFALALIAVFGPWKINPLWIVLGGALTGYLLF